MFSHHTDAGIMETRTVMKSLRKCFTKLSNMVSRHSERITHDQWFEYAAASSPSNIGTPSHIFNGFYHLYLLCVSLCINHFVQFLVVPDCGKLFEWYMDVCAPYAQNRIWNNVVSAAEQGNGFPLDQDVQHAIKSHNANGFVGWCLYHVSAIGTASRRQMFYHTFVATYFGLSREGIDMLSRYGFTQALRTFDDTRDDMRITNFTKTRYTNHCFCSYSASVC